MRQQQIEQLVIKRLFQRQRLAFRGENFVLILFKFRDDVAFSVFQRLTTHVMHWHQMTLSTADLNVIAVNRVEANLQGIQPQLFTLTYFQPVEIVGRAVRQRAPLVKFSVIAGSDNAAIAHQHRRRFDNRPFQQLAQFVKLSHLLTQRGQMAGLDAFQLRIQFRQLLKSMTHTRQIARTCGAQRQTRKNTLQIAHLTQHRLQLAAQIL